MNKLKTFLLLIILGFSTLFIIPNTLNAATVYFKTTSSASKVVVGKSFNVTVKVSSSEKLGTWEYTINYNSGVLYLVSGQKSVADPGNGTQTSATYSYTFKAIKSGSSDLSVKSYGAFNLDEAVLTPSVSGTSVTVITQAQLESSYSKDNNLKSLSVDGATISPAFSSGTTAYTTELNSNTTQIKINASPNDSKASVSGSGTFDVIEGENKFTITVTAENSSTKTYTLIANVIDPNPITVTTEENEKMTVVKRESSLVAPNLYTKSTVTIDEQVIPTLINNITKLTLVGLKGTDGTVNLYIYKDGKYTKYNELKLSSITLFIINQDKEELFGCKKTSIKINKISTPVYKYSKDSTNALIYAMNTATGEKSYYIYDIKNNTAVIYDNEQISALNTKLGTYKKIIIGLLVESGIFIILIITLLAKTSKKNKLQKEEIKEQKEKLIKEDPIIEEEVKIEKIEQERIPEVKPKKKTEKKKEKK